MRVIDYYCSHKGYQKQREAMNKKGRLIRAEIALGSLAVATLLSADAFANRNTLDYFHTQALQNIFGFVAVSVLLFAWNAIQYALALRSK